MSTTLDMCKQELQNNLERSIRLAICVKLAEQLQNQLTETLFFWTNSGKINCSCTTRETLQVLLSVCPLWKKNYTTTSIEYSGTYMGHEILVEAYNDALPATCKMVEVEEIVPAQEAKPATTRIVKKLQCNESITSSPAS